MLSTSTIEIIVLVILGYLIGSLCFAVIFARLFGAQDPRQLGSGNPGASNMLRVAGRLPALLTLVCDFAKAYIPIYILSAMDSYDSMIIAAVGLAIILGHLFPIYHRFKGGKGVATYMGFYLAAWPLLGWSTVGAWFLFLGLFNYVSVASILAAFFALWVADGMPGSCGMPYTPPYILGSVLTLIIAILVLLRHWSNIKKLKKRTEERFIK